IICTHCPIHCNFGDENVLAWDYHILYNLCIKFKCVKMILAGHVHDGDSIIDKYNIIHRTLQGVIETEENQDCFITAYFFKNSVYFKGYGKIKDEYFTFRKHDN